MEFTPGEINIICSNVNASHHFYCDVLGFVSTTDAEGYYHLLSSGRHFLLLPIASQQSEISPYGSLPQLSMDLIVGDIQAAYHYLKDVGVDFAQEWQKGKVMFVIRDPDGLPLEIIQSGLDIDKD